MAANRNLPLRVLYTINSSPQYILARSYAPIPISHIPTQSKSLEHANVPVLADYAAAPLKMCLDTICRSSPELIQDRTRDYSVYVLDPLESNSAPAPVQIPNSNSSASMTRYQDASSQARGVAVGLGLMSWAMLANDTCCVNVTGTLIKQGNGQEALEVIFALRETAAMNFSSLPQAVRSWGLTPNPSTVTQHISSVTCEKPFSIENSQLSSSSSSGHSSTLSRPASTAPAHHPTPSTSQSPPPSQTSSASTTVSTLSSIQLRTKSKAKPKKASRISNTPITESDKLMSVAETYIGPLKKKGRPKSSTSHKNQLLDQVASASVSKNDLTAIDHPESGEGYGVQVHSMDIYARMKDSPAEISQKHKLQKKKRTFINQLTPPFSTTPLIRQFGQTVSPLVKEEKQDDKLLLDILTLLTAPSSGNATGSNATVLAVLNTIDSMSAKGPSSTSEPNQALISAISQLLSQQLLSVRSNQEIPKQPNQATDISSQRASDAHTAVSNPNETHDDDIVVLDKENIDPTVFRRKTDRDYEESKLNSTLSIPLGAPFAESSAPDRPSQGLVLGRSNENSPPKIGHATNSCGPQPIRRKRTLSEFMDERESSKHKGRVRERERTERSQKHRPALHHRQSSSENISSYRHYSRLLLSQSRPEQPSNSHYRTGMEPWTSPPRSRNENTNSWTTAHGISQPQFLAHPKSPKIQIVSASSPVRSNVTQTRLKYRVPEWARTNTSTQPRLSEEAQRALAEAEAERKREKNAVRRKKAMEAANQDGANQKMPRVPGANASLNPNPKDSLSKKNAIVFQGPIAALSNGVIFSSSGSSSIPRSPSPKSRTSIPPQTPKQAKRTTQLTPKLQFGTLFTPSMNSHYASSSSLFGSPLFSPTAASPSPLSTRSLRACSVNKNIQQTPGTRLDKSERTDEKSEREDLNHELDSAFEELECPPSSLPIASSDIDMDEAIAQASIEINAQDHDQVTYNGEDLCVEQGTKQHWEGLPPSSPPPPTSPALIPEVESEIDKEMDDLELPLATSDSENEYCTSIGLSPSDDFSAYSEDELLSNFLENDFTRIFSDAEQRMPSETDIFNQYTHHDTQSDDAQGLMDLGMDANPQLSAFQNGLEDIDFTEFWETFKPLVHDHTNISQVLSKVPSMDFGFGSMDGTAMSDMGELDHTKLAEDIQALFSGCLM